MAKTIKRSNKSKPATCGQLEACINPALECWFDKLRQDGNLALDLAYDVVLIREFMWNLSVNKDFEIPNSRTGFHPEKEKNKVSWNHLLAKVDSEELFMCVLDKLDTYTSILDSNSDESWTAFVAIVNSVREELASRTSIKE